MGGTREVIIKVFDQSDKGRGVEGREGSDKEVRGEERLGENVNGKRD